MHTYDIGATLRQYAMSIHLNDFLESVEVKQVVADAVGSDYYLAPLFATGEHTRGHEQTWRFKHFTKDGREIEDDELARLRTFD